jgi:hypothetical protein
LLLFFNSRINFSGVLVKAENIPEQPAQDNACEGRKNKNFSVLLLYNANWKNVIGTFQDQ